MSEYEIKTQHQNRRMVKERLEPHGTVVENWPDGSFNFRPYEDEEANMAEVCEDLGIEIKLI